MEIAEMVERYSRDLPRHEGTRRRTDGDVYAVTGTTGSLGAAFVALLLAQPHVKKVYALNRRHGSQSIASHQEAAFADKGLDLSQLRDAVSAGRVEFEAGKHRLGINDGAYSKVLPFKSSLQDIVIVSIAKRYEMSNLRTGGPFDHSP